MRRMSPSRSGSARTLVSFGCDARVGSPFAPERRNGGPYRSKTRQFPTFSDVGLIAQLSNREEPCNINEVETPSDEFAGFQPAIPVKVTGRGPLQDHEIDQIVKLYTSGQSVRQVAASMGLHKTTISIHLERRGVPRRGCTRILTDSQCAQIVKLYQSGLSLTQIGDRYGVHAKTVSNELKKLNVSVRPASKHNR